MQIRGTLFPYYEEAVADNIPPIPVLRKYILLE
jgi:hypothetical protein